MLISLAWRNIWRQPYRTALSLASIGLACVITIFLLSLQQGSYAAIRESALMLLDGFAQVQPQGYADDPDLRAVIEDPTGLSHRLREIEGVTAAAPRALTYAILSNGARSFGGAIIGVDPDAEPAVSSLPKSIRTGRYLNATDDNAIVIGTALARNLDLSVGDAVTLLGSARDQSIAADVLTVVGIFETGSSELNRQVTEMPLPRFQSTFGMDGSVNVIVAVGDRLADIQGALPAMRAVTTEAGLVVRDWTELEPALRDAILLDMSISTLLYVSLIVVVVFIILNTLLMSVFERTREFGVLLALGMRQRLIGRMIWLELILLAGIGGIAGITIGVAITSWFARRGLTLAGGEALFAQFNMPGVLHPTVNMLSVLAGPTAIVLSICIAGLVPYLRARRLQPVAAMRAS